MSNRIKEFERNMLEWLKSEHHINKDGNLEMYWDYNDSINNETLRSILDEHYIDIKDEDFTIRDVILEHFDYFEQDRLDLEKNLFYTVVEHYGVAELLNIYNCEEHELYENILESFDNLHVGFESNISKSNVDNITMDIAISPSKYLEDDYFEFTVFQLGCDVPSTTKGCLNPKNPKISNKSEIEDTKDYINGVKVINYLIESQGYNFEDLYNTDIVSESKFLESLKVEISEYYNILRGMVLTATISTNVDDLQKIIKREGNIVLEPGFVELGFFNSMQGSGTGFVIELEKPLVIPKDCIHIIGLDEGHYTTEDVYGKSYVKQGDVKLLDGEIEFNMPDLERVIENVNKYHKSYENTK